MFDQNLENIFDSIVLQKTVRWQKDKFVIVAEMGKQTFRNSNYWIGLFKEVEIESLEYSIGNRVIFLYVLQNDVEGACRNRPSKVQ
jgi:hypothetical protein